MRVQKAVRQETLHIAAGVGLLSAAMLLVFFFLGRLDMTVVLGALLGGGFAVLNFFLLGLTVQWAVSSGDEGSSKKKIQLSYSLRMLLTLAVLLVGFAAPCFHWLSTVLPLFFPRLTIFGMQLLGLYKPEENTERGDGPDGA